MRAGVCPSVPTPPLAQRTALLRTRWPRRWCSPDGPVLPSADPDWLRVHLQPHGQGVPSLQVRPDPMCKPSSWWWKVHALFLFKRGPCRPPRHRLWAVFPVGWWTVLTYHPSLPCFASVQLHGSWGRRNSGFRRRWGSLRVVTDPVLLNSSGLRANALRHLLPYCADLGQREQNTLVFRRQSSMEYVWRVTCHFSLQKTASAGAALFPLKPGWNSTGSLTSTCSWWLWSLYLAGGHVILRIQWGDDISAPAMTAAVSRITAAFTSMAHGRERGSSLSVLIQSVLMFI